MKTHTPLKYYREQQERLNNMIPKINKLYSKIDKFIDDDTMFRDICRWSDVYISQNKTKIDFCFTSKEEYNAIKNALNLNKMKKNIDERSYTMSAELNDITIRFYWNLPDSCEIVTEYEYQDTYINPEDLKVDHVDKKVLKRVGKTVSVKCGDKSMLEAVFGEVN